MEVTSDNFDAELPIVLKAISDADFFSFDCEFSGLGKGTMGIGPYDTPEIIYSTLRENVQNYLIVQIGVSAFQYMTESKEWKYRSWSFYLFPRLPNSVRGFKNVYATTSAAIDTDSLDFLSQQNFDFNKWVRKGVNYLRGADADALGKEIQRRFDWASEHTADPAAKAAPRIPDAFKPKLNGILKDVEKYMEEASWEKLEETPPPLAIRDVTISERRLVESALLAKYGKGVYLQRATEVDDTGHKVFLVHLHSCPTLTHHAGFRKAKLAKELAEVEAARGFGSVMRAIGASGKPLVGHYVGLDLLHSIKAFFVDLPESWPSFKAVTAATLPLIYDTKHIANQAEGKLKAALKNGGSYSLGELRLAVNSDQFKTVPTSPFEDNYGYGGEGRLHDAGFDSFVTGSVFLHLGASLCGTAEDATFGLDWGRLEPFSNRFSPGRVLDLPFMGLGAVADPVPERAHVFYLESSAESWTNTEIHQLFSAWGNVHISWLNKTAAYVALYKKENAKIAAGQLIDAKRSLGIRGLSQLRIGGPQGAPISISVCRADEHAAGKEAELGRKRHSQSPAPTSPRAKVPAPPTPLPMLVD